MLQGKIAQFEHSMEQAPGLDRDGAAQSLQSENKSERFSLLEPPVLPDKPFKPNRMKILVLGFFFAMALSGGVDSGLLSAAAYRALGDRMIAVTVRSPVEALDDVDSARTLADQVGFPLRILDYDDLSNPEFVSKLLKERLR